MAFSGLKKHLNKANQFLNEKVGGVEATKLDDDFVAMEKKAELRSGLVEELQSKTKDYLQLNTSRINLTGRPKSLSSQPAGLLGDCLTTYGRKLEDHNNSQLLAESLHETGEGMRKLAEAKSQLDESVTEHFLKPLNNFQSKDIKDVEYQLDKVKSRRLEYDLKKTKVMKEKTKFGTSATSTTPASSAAAAVSEAEIKFAAGKFAESYQAAQIGMHHLAGKDLETVQQLSVLAASLQTYHLQCAEILKSLCHTLEEKKYDLSRANDVRSVKAFIPKTLPELEPYLGDSPACTSPKSPNSHGLESSIPVWKPQPSSYRPASYQAPPSCQALYDFAAQMPNELSFKTGDSIQLLRRVDDDWFEGTLNGRTGLFPVNYVHVVVSL